jgi:methyl-accepting chemotaxis protein
VAGKVRLVSDIVDDISGARHEQCMGLGQIGDAAMQMDQTPQQNATLVEQSSEAAASQRQQAGQLVYALPVFQLGSTLAA